MKCVLRLRESEREVGEEVLMMMKQRSRNNN